MNATENKEAWVTAQQVADHFGFSKRHVFELIHAGMPSSKLGNSRRFLLSVCDEWALAQSSHKPVPTPAPRRRAQNTKPVRRVRRVPQVGDAA
ncbi:unannotated protein [freshwater metagenome]|uniref:Unannotated protein n=1 Tax=freshwater metagenome TaxID=449393 RepID=A0A6J6EVK3_9ZZZZ|nr:hypothetical protein [Actinomycetota bacterium]